MSDLNNNTSEQTTKKSFNLPAYINIPFFLYQDQRLDRSCLLLASFIYSLFTSGKRIKVSNPYLIQLLGIHERNIRQTLESLEYYKYIKRIGNGSRREIIWLFSPDSKVFITDESCNPDDNSRVGQKTNIPDDNSRVTRTTTAGLPGRQQPGYIKEDIKEDIKEIYIEKNGFFDDYKKQEIINLNMKKEEAKNETYKNLAISNERCIDAFDKLWANVNATIEQAYDACQSYWETKGEIANWGMFIKFLKNPKSQEIFQEIPIKDSKSVISNEGINNPFEQHMKAIREYKHAESFPDKSMLLAIFKTEEEINKIKDLNDKFESWKRDNSL